MRNCILNHGKNGTTKLCSCVRLLAVYPGQGYGRCSSNVSDNQQLQKINTGKAPPVLCGEKGLLQQIVVIKYDILGNSNGNRGCSGKYAFAEPFVFVMPSLIVSLHRLLLVCDMPSFQSRQRVKWFKLYKQRLT